jgi:2-oxo-hept-3-ene-1,7-dioate hydratase
MLSHNERLAAADLLVEADRTKSPIIQLSKTFPHIEIDDSYAIQNELIRRKVESGRRIIGHKIGLTSKAIQKSSQVDEPD